MISDETWDWLTVASNINRGPDDNPHHIEWSRCTSRLAMAQVYSSNRSRIVQTMTFTIPMMTKTEFNLIQWDDLLAATYDHLINRFAFAYSDKA